MSSPTPPSPGLDSAALLEAFFERSQDGFFFMMIDEPIEWGPGVDKEATLDYVFSRWLTAGVGYTYSSRKAKDIPNLPTGFAFDYTKHEVYLKVRGTY